MKLLINASTLSSTGVTQVAVSFIEECKKIIGHTYYILVSDDVSNQINQREYPDNFIFHTITLEPRLLFTAFSVAKQLKKLESELKPDCTFSIFGPSYWTPKSKHLMGYASGHYIYEDSPFFSHTSLYVLFDTFLRKTFHRYFLVRNGKYYVCETEDVKQRLPDFLGVNNRAVYTVSNSYNHFFENYSPRQEVLLPKKEENEFRFLSLCAFAPHKNLAILNKVIPLVKKVIKNFKITFILTVDDASFQSKLSDEARASIINLGRIDADQCPQLYYECDALFLPTLIECFSANYPEAMKMERPILTSNLSFAASVCEDAALYFDPIDEQDIVAKMNLLLNDASLKKELIKAGKERVKTFNSAEQRAHAYLNICNSISTEQIVK
ncbi:glycosyltransferase involved in cell wall biosynthesis [Pedobacter sp. CAN_A7]|uniref:glycosyltransferase n=1 Tax=Pedobacter sp. CAN_A7 TaxID=2787722 RepID=UPI0018C8D931